MTTTTDLRCPRCASIMLPDPDAYDPQERACLVCGHHTYRPVAVTDVVDSIGRRQSGMRQGRRRTKDYSGA